MNKPRVLRGLELGLDPQRAQATHSIDDVLREVVRPAPPPANEKPTPADPMTDAVATSDEAAPPVTEPGPAPTPGELTRDRGVDGRPRRATTKSASGSQGQKTSSKSDASKSVHRGAGAVSKPVTMPSLPELPRLARRIDATYVPRYLFLRVPFELRDQVRQAKSQLRAQGESLSEGEIIEAGCRLLPSDPEAVFELALSVLRRQSPREVAVNPIVRAEMHEWLEQVTVMLHTMGLRAGVSTVAKIALEAFVQNHSGRHPE